MKKQVLSIVLLLASGTTLSTPYDQIERAIETYDVARAKEQLGKLARHFKNNAISTQDALKQYNQLADFVGKRALEVEDGMHVGAAWPDLTMAVVGSMCTLTGLVGYARYRSGSLENSRSDGGNAALLTLFGVWLAVKGFRCRTQEVRIKNLNRINDMLEATIDKVRQTADVNA